MQRRESQAHDTRHLEAGARARDKTLFFNHRRPLYVYTYIYETIPPVARKQQRKEYPVSVGIDFLYEKQGSNILISCQFKIYSQTQKEMPHNTKSLTADVV
uniref:Uncharacterized protein n=1 Tax=Trichogramma kaykai TaxID=54128 RepID=A0ABD2WCP7_9HYME